MQDRNSDEHPGLQDPEECEDEESVDSEDRCPSCGSSDLRAHWLVRCSVWIIDQVIEIAIAAVILSFIFGALTVGLGALGIICPVVAVLAIAWVGVKFIFPLFLRRRCLACGHTWVELKEAMKEGDD